jgi:hypothetical protein
MVGPLETHSCFQMANLAKIISHVRNKFFTIKYSGDLNTGQIEFLHSNAGVNSLPEFFSNGLLLMDYRSRIHTADRLSNDTRLLGQKGGFFVIRFMSSVFRVVQNQTPGFLWNWTFVYWTCPVFGSPLWLILPFDFDTFSWSEYQTT